MTERFTFNVFLLLSDLTLDPKSIVTSALGFSLLREFESVYFCYSCVPNSFTWACSASPTRLYVLKDRDHLSHISSVGMLGASDR